MFFCATKVLQLLPEGSTSKRLASEGSLGIWGAFWRQQGPGWSLSEMRRDTAASKRSSWIGSVGGNPTEVNCHQTNGWRRAIGGVSKRQQEARTGRIQCGVVEDAVAQCVSSLRQRKRCFTRLRSAPAHGLATPQMWEAALFGLAGSFLGSNMHWKEIYTVVSNDCINSD